MMRVLIAEDHVALATCVSQGLKPEHYTVAVCSEGEQARTRAGERIDVATKEFALLEYLMRNAGSCVTSAMIIEHVWNLTFDTTTNVVDVYINYLRRKVDDGHATKLIHTVRGVGYELSGTPEARS